MKTNDSLLFKIGAVSYISAAIFSILSGSYAVYEIISNKEFYNNPNRICLEKIVDLPLDMAIKITKCNRVNLRY